MRDFRALAAWQELYILMIFPVYFRLRAKSCLATLPLLCFRPLELRFCSSFSTSNSVRDRVRPRDARAVSSPPLALVPAVGSCRRGGGTRTSHSTTFASTLQKTPSPSSPPSRMSGLGGGLYRSQKNKNSARLARIPCFSANPVLPLTGGACWCGNTCHRDLRGHRRERTIVERASRYRRDSHRIFCRRGSLNWPNPLSRKYDTDRLRRKEHQDARYHRRPH